ncbi:MAG: ABC transporter ATP-binding protein [Planctomycetota bacterium]
MSLRVRELRHAFVDPDGKPAPVLDVPELDVDEAEQVALVGGSGTGKTTLLHCLAGIVQPDAGEVTVAGVDIASLPEAQRDAFRGRYVGYVFQTHHLLPGLNARENVLLGMTFAGGKPDRQRADDLLCDVGLGDRLDYLPGKLSVGQQQRVAVARALANRPKLLLADEPTGALDASTAQAVITLIKRLATEAGATLIVVTHDAAVAGALPRTLDLADINRAAVTAEVPA